MKNKGIIVVIALLSVWAILATITAVDNENRRSKLYDERAELREECAEREREYDKLSSEHAELEAERKELKSDRLKGFAYEWVYDMVCHINDEGYSPDAALDKICEREGLQSYERVAITIYADGIIKYQ